MRVRVREREREGECMFINNHVCAHTTEILVSPLACAPLNTHIPIRLYTVGQPVPQAKHNTQLARPLCSIQWIKEFLIHHHAHKALVWQ